MKETTYIVAFIGGCVFCFLMISLGIVDRVDGIPGTEQEPVFSLPTYLSFVSILLTAIGVMLTGLGIGVGLVAFYTFKGIKDEVQVSLDLKAKEAERRLELALAKVDQKASEALSEEAINARIDQIALGRRQNPTVAELEEGFDPTDNGNR